MSKIIVSVHMPKVAGTSLLHQLKDHYGEHKILLDYDDDPVDVFSVANIDPNRYDAEPIKSIAPHEIVHGHFHPHKYANLTNAFRMTFLRHPVDNIISIYNFWMAHDRDCWHSPIFQYCKDENLSILRFAMLPKIRYLYTKTYFGGFDMAAFDFIGDYSKYDEELIRLGNQLGRQLDAGVRLNITKDYLGNTETNGDDVRPIGIEEGAALAEILKEDIAFYTAHCRGASCD